MKLKILFFLLALLPGLSACVTTTTGGFNVEPSQERALQDFIQLATAYYEAGNMTAARRHITNALAINSRSAEAYNVQALVLQREGEIRLAEESFRQALSYDQNNSRARNNYAAFLFAQERFEDAYRQLERVSADTNYEARALVFENLGLAALQTQRQQQAIAAFERALLLDTNMYRSALELALVKFELGEFAESMRYYNQFLVSSNFFNVPQTARSLWLGVQLERRFDNPERAAIYGILLERLYADSMEYQYYKNSSND